MRAGYLYSVVFALFVSASIAAIAAPNGGVDAESSHTAVDVAPPSMPGKIDLNTADAATLQKELTGVGEAKAQSIIAYRETNGPFSSVDELLEVKGIGKAILDRNRGKLETN
jgi:competence protein ComEA